MQRSLWSVLVVEDPATIGQPLAPVAHQHWGCHVVTSCDGLEAVALTSAVRFDLVFLNLSVPAEGMKVLTALKANAQTACVPVVNVCGFGCDQNQYMEVLAAGALACVDKNRLIRAFDETLKQVLPPELQDEQK